MSDMLQLVASRQNNSGKRSDMKENRTGGDRTNKTYMTYILVLFVL